MGVGEERGRDKDGLKKRDGDREELNEIGRWRDDG